MPKKFTLIFDYDDFLQQKKRPPIFTNQRAHDVTLGMLVNQSKTT